MTLPAPCVRLAVAGVFAAGFAVAAAPASAADLPTGTFKLQSAHGICADVSPYPGRVGDLLRQQPCTTLDLDQQFISDLLTKQLRSVSRVGKCIEGVFDEGDLGEPVASVQVKSCDNAEPGQKWSRSQLSSGEWTVSPYSDLDYALSADGDTGAGVSLDFTPSSPGVDFRWTFPLI